MAMLSLRILQELAEEAAGEPNLSSNNHIIGTFLYFVGAMAVVIFIGALLTSNKVAK
jgi:hypothetical protein